MCKHKGELTMKRIWSSWLKEALFIYCAVYTVATLANSVLYLLSGVRDDPSGNWHELTRALIVLIGVVAYEMALHLPIRNIFVRALAVYVPTQLLAFLAVWSTKFIEPLAKSAYRDIFINYTGLFIVVAVISVVVSKLRARNKRKL